ILIGAVFYLWLPQALFFEQRQSFEFAALVLFLLVLIFVYGGGRFSVDHLLTRKEKGGLQPQSAAWRAGGMWLAASLAQSCTLSCLPAGRQVRQIANLRYDPRLVER